MFIATRHGEVRDQMTNVEMMAALDWSFLMVSARKWTCHQFVQDDYNTQKSNLQHSTVSGEAVQ